MNTKKNRCDFHEFIEEIYIGCKKGIDKFHTKKDIKEPVFSNNLFNKSKKHLKLGKF